MSISYKPLWRLLLENDMKKKDLQKITGLSSSTIAKLGKNQNIQTDILDKICQALDCNIEDIIEIKITNGEQRNDKK